MANTKKGKTAARRAPARKTMKRRRPSAPKDGTNLLVNTYFRARIPITDNEQAMNYSIFVDPKNGKVELPAGSTITLDDYPAPLGLAFSFRWPYF